MMHLLLITLMSLQTYIATMQEKILQSDFSVTVSMPSAQPMRFDGSVTMHGRQFVLSVLSMEAAYDGASLYLYQDETEELTISSPTEEELQSTNPFLFAQALVPVCRVTERYNVDKTETVFTLYPKDVSDPQVASLKIQSMTLRVRNRDNMPLSLELKENEKTTLLTLTNPQYILDLPKFVLTKEGAYINDLR